MQMELNEETTNALAKAIALANITAHSDYISEKTANWPEEFQREIRTLSGSDAERFQAVRSMEPRAAMAIEQKAKEKAREDVRLAAINERELARVNEEIRRRGLVYDAQIAQWRCDVAAANTARKQAPPEPKKPPTTFAELKLIEKAREYSF